MSKVLILSGDDLNRLLTPEKLIPAIEECFIKYSRREVVMPSRQVMWIHGNWWGIMPSHIKGYGIAVKVVSVIPSNRDRNLPTIPGAVLYFDEETGLLKALMDGAVLTGLRTAAAVSLSIKYLKPTNSGILAILGTGYQARYQVRFASKVFNVEKLKIYDIRRKAMEEFKEYAEGELGLEVYMAEDPKDAINDADIIIEASTAEKPIIYGRSIKRPCHIASIGAHALNMRVLDDDVIKKADLIVVDSKDATYNETGDIRTPINRGLIKINDLIEIGEFISKGISRGLNDITIFKTVGIAIEDLCAAYKAYELACKKDIGKIIEI